MKKLCLILLLVYTSLHSQNFNQDKVRLNFIIMIDNEILDLNITEGVFIVKDNEGKIQNEFPFDYYVGDISLEKKDYEKLFNLDSNSEAVVRFKYTKSSPKYLEEIYEYSINAGWFSNRYMLLSIYNANKQNRKKYYFGKEKFVTEFKSPNGRTIAVQVK